MFANTDCPGEPFHNRFPELAEKVNARLGVSPAPAHPSTDASIEELANAVIAGQYGNGEDRKNALGDNYNAVQARVNEILSGGSTSAPSVDIESLAQAVIHGDYGNGEDRKNALGDNYDAVQARVNEILSGNHGE
jgi:beta-mannanase